MKTVKQKIKEHYDLVSPFYKNLWGSHIHHGYHITNKESSEEAAENLIKLLVEKSELKKDSKVLDIGCGIGGTSIWLAKNYDCKVTGITISPVQVQMANIDSKNLKNKPEFFVHDADNLKLKGQYDFIWATEMISHLHNRSSFFKHCHELLVPGGKMCIAAWIKDGNLSEEQEKKYIKPIEKGMMVTLPSFQEYEKRINDNDFRLLYEEDISLKVKKTWDLCLKIISDPSLWKLAMSQGKEFVDFLKAFVSMRKGFSSGNFRYAAIVIQKKA